jgi:hypothetical protein
VRYVTEIKSTDLKHPKSKVRVVATNPIADFGGAAAQAQAVE